MRLALGVGRGRLIRLLVAESLVLGVAGGVAGLAMAFAGGRFVRGVLLPNVAWTDAGVDLRVFAVTAIAAIVTGIVVGLVPALAGDASRAARPRSSPVRGKEVLPQSASHDAHRDAGRAVGRVVGGCGVVRAELVEGDILELGLEPRRILLISFDWPTVVWPVTGGETAGRLRQHAFYEEALARVRSHCRAFSARPSWSARRSSRRSASALRVPGRDSLPMLARWPSVDPRGLR